MIRNIYRADPTNVGDWYCSPLRYFNFGEVETCDIKSPIIDQGDRIIVGGGGLISVNFQRHMERLHDLRARMGALVAWGIGESLVNDKAGGLVGPWHGQLPSYLRSFDLVGLRDYGTEYRWVPCASCMLDHFDGNYPIEHEVCIYEHKRIPIPIEGPPRRSNDGNDIDGTLAFLGSAELVVTNSYHGAYWAMLLGRKVIAIPNLSKMYGFRHAPIICRPDQWRERRKDAVAYEGIVEDCRSANRDFYDDVRGLIGTC